MKLKIRYENEYQTIVLDEKDTEAMWVSLSLEGEGLSQKEKEQLIQDTFEERFNRPDYNSWHKHDRHHGNTKAQVFEDEDTGFDTEDGGSWCEPLMSEVADDSIFRGDEIHRQQQWDDEAWCDRIRSAMKPDYAEMIIAIALHGMSVGEYAASVGEPDANKISHRYRRAVKKFQEIFPRTSF